MDWSKYSPEKLLYFVAGVIPGFSAIGVPSLRHRWVLAPSMAWILILALEIVGIYRKWRNKWTTLDAQIKYLSEIPPLGQRTT